jgi:hypothetical protein
MKMTKKFKSLDESFNIEDNTIDTDVVETEVGKNDDIIPPSKENIDDVKNDYSYTRTQLYSLIEKGQEAINGILELAQESEMPRAYEVAGQLIKNVADATDKLMDLQKKLKEVEDSKGIVRGPTNVTNALFVGSTADLAKLLKNNNLKQDEDTK